MLVNWRERTVIRVEKWFIVSGWSVNWDELELVSKSDAPSNNVSKRQIIEEAKFVWYKLEKWRMNVQASSAASQSLKRRWQSSDRTRNGLLIRNRPICTSTIVDHHWPASILDQTSLKHFFFKICEPASRLPPNHPCHSQSNAGWPGDLEDAMPVPEMRKREMKRRRKILWPGEKWIKILWSGEKWIWGERRKYEARLKEKESRQNGSEKWVRFQ